MKFIVVGFLLLAVSSIVGQSEDVLTAEQCQADQRLWLSQLEDSNFKLPSYDTVANWHREMIACETVDPGNSFKYYNTQSEIASDKSNRLKHFLDRHGLWKQFEQEDLEGKR